MDQEVQSSRSTKWNWKWRGRWEGYQFRDLRKDAIAGITVGIIAIPLGMAFAIASGVKPEYGLYTTVIAGILIALFGGSRYQVGGPTGAFIPILLAIVLQYGYENLLIAGMMAGAMLVILGALRLGKIIQYIPRPVTVGFTAGIAVIIFTGQLGNFLGLTNLESHERFLDSLKELLHHLPESQWRSILIVSVTLALLIIMDKFFPRVPASLFALVVSTVLATVFFANQVPTIGSVFGEIPGTLPKWHVPELSLDQIRVLLGPAFTIAMLGAIESLLSAVVADGMTGTRHDSNRELIGQGIANIVTPLFGGIPATGAIARTATNIKNGAVSPFSAMINGLTVLVVLLTLAPLASRIPLAGMAPILMLVAWNMSLRRHFVHLLSMRNSDSLVTAITFLLTVFVNLTVAVGVGIVLAALFFISRMSDMLTVAKAPSDDATTPSITLYKIKGPLFFGTAQYFLNTMMEAIRQTPRVLILHLDGMPFLDASGEANLRSVIRHLQDQGSAVLLAEVPSQPRDMMQKSGLYYQITRESIFDRLEDAMEYARTWAARFEDGPFAMALDGGKGAYNQIPAKSRFSMEH